MWNDFMWNEYVIFWLCLVVALLLIAYLFSKAGDQTKALLAKYNTAVERIATLEKAKLDLEMALGVHRGKIEAMRRDHEVLQKERDVVAKNFTDAQRHLRETQAALSEKQVLLKQIERELKARRVGNPGSPINEDGDDILSMIRGKGVFERIHDASLESAYKSVCADNERLRAEVKEMRLRVDEALAS